MKVWRRSRGLARLAGGVTVALGVAGMAAAPAGPAQARVTPPILRPHGVASWGDNSAGELGNGTTTGQSRYGDISGLGGDVVQVSAGLLHGLAIRSGGTVWAWGFNFSGEVGDGTTTNRSTPVQVAGLTGITQVAAGQDFSLARRSDGTVWAWGGNGHGEIGNGTISQHQLTPVQVTGLTGVTKIAAGADFGLALRSDGTVWAWGDNQSGQLGNGTTANSLIPIQVSGLSQVTSISAGFDFSLATRPRGNTALTSVWAWGGNSLGQLGDGTFNSRVVPEAVAGIGTSFIAGVAAGDDYGMVLGTDGSVWGWGADYHGQLGNAPASAPVTHPVNTIGAGSGITQLATGADHVLGLKSDGTVLAWGNDHFGQLGNGTSAESSGPVQVTGLTGASQVSAGWGFSLAVHVVPLVAQGAALPAASADRSS